MNYKVFYDCYKTDSHQLQATAEAASLASETPKNEKELLWYRLFYEAVCDGFLVVNGEAEVEADCRMSLQ